MLLDVRTLFILLVLSAVLMSVALSFGLRASRSAGFAKWNAGLWLIALAWILIAARPALPKLLGFALADAVMLGGLSLHIAALVEFTGERAPRPLWLLPGPALFAAVLAGGKDFATFTLIVSSAFAAALLGIGVCALRLSRAGIGPVRWMMAAFYFAASLGIFARALYVWFFPAETPDVFASGTAQSVAFVLQFAVTIAGSFGYLSAQRERAENALRRLSMYDALTELLNRRAFMELAGREYVRARRDRLPLAVLMLDLDHFKAVNDIHGHQTGDEVLREFARRSKAALREVDLLCRYGGEEFCALLSGTATAAGMQVAERIRAAVASAPCAPGVAVTVSVGVAALRPGEELAAVIGRSDEALYRAKKDGRDCVRALDAEELARAA